MLLSVLWFKIRIDMGVYETLKMACVEISFHTPTTRAGYWCLQYRYDINQWSVDRKKVLNL